MADVAGIQPEMTENRKPRDDEIGGSTAKDGNGKIEEEANDQGSSNERVESGPSEDKQGDEKKLSKLKDMWGKLGLDMGTIMMMFKYAWPTCIN
jgi:hypothetical protein